MAVTETSGVRASGSGNSGTASATFAGATTSGRLLICTYYARNQSSTHPATPSGWSIARQHVNGGGSTAGVFYKIADGTETSVSLTLNASNAWTIHLQEFNSSDGWAASPLDKVNSDHATTGTTNTAGATGVLAQANELVVTLYANQTTATWSSHDNGQTEIQETVSGTTANQSTAWVEVSATTSVSYSATLSSSGAWQAIVATFKIQQPGAITMSTTLGISTSMTAHVRSNISMTATFSINASIVSYAQGTMTASFSINGSGTLTAVTYAQASMFALFGMQMSVPAQSKVNISMSATLGIACRIKRGGDMTMTAGFSISARMYPEVHYGAKFRQKLGDVYYYRDALKRAIADRLKYLAEASSNVLNPSFENDMLSWTSLDPGWSTMVFASAVHGSKVAVKSGGWADATMRNDGRLACSSGKRVVAAVAVRSSGATGSIGAEIHWFDQNGSYISKDSAITTTAASASGTFIQTRCVAVAPAGSAFGCIAVRVTGHTSGTWYADQATLEIQAQNQTDMPPVGIGSVNSRWTGLTISSTYDSASPADVTISCTAATLVAGDISISYNSSSVHVSQARSTTVTYQLYYLDPTFSGGSKTLNATTDANNIANNNAVVWVGSVAVTVPGSGGGSGGGGDPGGGCVEESMWIDGERQAVNICPGMNVDCVEFPVRRSKRNVMGVKMADEPCYELVTEFGARIIASASTPMTLQDGSYVLFPEMEGKTVLVDRGDCGLIWERVAELSYVGIRTVARISVGGGTYFAGSDPAARIATHNALKP